MKMEIKTQVMPNGMTALVRQNGSISYRSYEAALEALREIRQQGIDAKIFTPENCPIEFIIVLEEHRHGVHRHSILRCM